MAKNTQKIEKIDAVKQIGSKKGAVLNFYYQIK